MSRAVEPNDENRAEESEDPRSPALPLKILVVDDEESIRVTLADDLADVGHEVATCASGDEALEILSERVFDVVVTDLKLPGASGLDVLDLVRRRGLPTEVILVTAYGTVENAVEAMRKGAYHYVLKPFLNEEILMLVARIARVRRLERSHQRLAEEVGRLDGFENLVASSPAMREVLEVVRTVAASDATVLLEGESGTGKEVVARAIHRNSPRREGPFVAISCAALPESLLEAELFGHEAGAFTDARKARRGRFELAHGGTLFLDDVDDVPLAVQVKLLRALQERTVERVGGEKPIDVDIRVVAATKRDLFDLVRKGEFREDLYYRLAVVPIQLPPLRDRPEDVPLLVAHFLQRYAPGGGFVVDEETLQALASYSWPGNVRELENAVQRAVAMAGPEKRLRREHLLLPVLRRSGSPSEGGGPVRLRDVVRQAEREHILRILRVAGHHRRKAAELLGISRKNLWEKMREYGIKGDE